tara:strand:+ start:744 stop:2423 length:1680 start_codon:yes stop_codon:yes gene_type:complete
MSSFDKIIRDILADIFAEEEQQQVTRPRARPEGLMSSLRPQARPEPDEPIQPSASESTSKFTKLIGDNEDTPEEGVEIPLNELKINARDMEGRYQTSAAQFYRLNKGIPSTSSKVKVAKLIPDTEVDELTSEIKMILDSTPTLKPRARPKSVKDIDVASSAMALGVIPVKGKSYTPTIRDTQIMLDSAGYNVGKIDGIDGSLTQAAVKAFQKDAGFTGRDVDGKFGPKTLAAFIEKNPQVTKEKLPITKEELPPIKEETPSAPLSEGLAKRPGIKTLDPLKGTVKKVEDFLTTEDEDLQDQYEQDSIEAKEIVLRPRARPDDVESIPTGIMVRPRSRPNDAVPVTSEVVNLLEGITNPIDAVIKLGYIKDRNVSTRKKKSRYESLLNEKDNNDTIAQMFMDAIGEFKNPMKTAWCATFVDHILNELGVKRLETDDKYDRLRAKAYENYGDAVENINAAKRGDIAVIHSRDIVYDKLTGEVITNTLSREDLDSKYRKDTEKYRIAPGYHVGFIESIDDKTGTVSILGGNQKDSVSLSAFKENYIISIRRIVPEDVGKPIL